MNNLQDFKWSENVILVDADYADKVAFDLIVNFERMIGRRIPQADMARWIDCLALDGGLRPQDGQPSGAAPQETHVVLIHSKGRTRMDNFTPGLYAEELNGKAFRDSLGEFVLSAYAVEDMVSRADFFMDVLQTVGAQQEVRRLMVVPDEALLAQVREALRRLGDSRLQTGSSRGVVAQQMTLFAMQPIPGGDYRQEILGYSLMSALGIRADEIPDSSF